MSDDIKKKLGIQDTHQQMYDELFAEMVARAVDNDPQMVASTFVALGLRHEWEQIAECIVTDQVPASDIAKFFQNKAFYKFYKKNYMRGR